MMESYRTIREASSDELTIQKSRFICYASPCDTEEEAQQFIRILREKYRDARHHCYAYIIGANSGIMRYSDDGEPSGTAGMPMMDVLKNEGIVNCCVVIVRYFGGILLGTGGLVRAYTQGCKAAIHSSHIVSMELSEIHEACVSYSVWNQLEHCAASLPIRMQEVRYTDQVNITFCVRKKDSSASVWILENKSEGRITWLNSRELYAPWDQEP